MYIIYVCAYVLIISYILYIYMRFISDFKLYIQVVPGRAGGGSFRRKKNYIAKKNLPIECAQGD